MSGVSGRIVAGSPLSGHGGATLADRGADASRLDAFYTRPAVAEACLEDLFRVLPGIAIPDEPLFVEPSAGAGAFHRHLPPGRRIGMDLEPACDGIARRDFLDWTPDLPLGREAVVVVGNPPFGKRGRLALRFFQRAAEFADTIGFILPLNFRKYGAHRHLPPGFRWIFARTLAPDSFVLGDGRPYRVNTEFQIWTRARSPHRDRRLLRPPPIRHPDFLLWQYNNTRDALKVFENDFDFGVPCQGWQDYSRRETDADRCEKHKQWMLFKARTPLALEQLRSLDFGDLARRTATAVPGFRKCDLVREYVDRYDEPGRPDLSRPEAPTAR